MSSIYDVPLIAVSGCSRPGGADGGLMYRVDDKYVLAIAEEIKVLPLMIPPIGDLLAAEALLRSADGILLTGSLSDIDPSAWNGVRKHHSSETIDRLRDSTIIPLIPSALQVGVPILGICRGLQEINVAFGGTVGELEDKKRHRLHKEVPKTVAEQPEAVYGAVHPISLQPNGILHKLVHDDGNLWVNSYHQQVIEQLSPSLTVDAVSPDGHIEAISRTADRAPCLGVQWHPEHELAREWLLSRSIFEWFGKQVRHRFHQRKESA